MSNRKSQVAEYLRTAYGEVRAKAVNMAAPPKSTQATRDFSWEPFLDAPRRRIIQAAATRLRITSPALYFVELARPAKTPAKAKLRADGSSAALTAKSKDAVTKNVITMSTVPK